MSYEWTKKKIINSKINLEPFPHLIIDDFLENDLYNEIINKIYSKDPFSQFPKENNRVTKMIYNLDNYGDKYFNVEDNIESEKKYADIIINNEIRSLICDKFKTIGSLESEIKHAGTWVQLDCFRDIYEYRIHHDSLCKYITIVLYLAKDKKHENLGTNLFDKDKKFIKNAGYKPNRCIIFHAEDKYIPEENKYPSWHNMEGKTEEGYRRFSFQSWYFTSKSYNKKYIRSGFNSP